MYCFICHSLIKVLYSSPSHVFSWSQCTVQNYKSIHNKFFQAGCHFLFVNELAHCIYCVAGETQPWTTSIPVWYFFLSYSFPSLSLHHVLVDHESGPEAAVPAWLQWWAEPDCEKFGHWNSLWQLRVLSLRLKQFQLRRLQLCLCLGAGTSSKTPRHKPIDCRTHSCLSVLTHCACVYVSPGEVPAWCGNGAGV